MIQRSAVGNQKDVEPSILCNHHAKTTRILYSPWPHILPDQGQIFEWFLFKKTLFQILKQLLQHRQINFSAA